MADMSINKQEIARMMDEIQREFDRHPIRLPIEAASAAPPDGTTVGSMTIFNGPVIHGNADGAQLAWGNESVSQQRTEQIAPGFEAIAQAVARTLDGLPSADLTENDRQEAEAAARDVLAEVTQPQPDRSKIRRALSSLKGLLAPLAVGLVEGTAAVGAREWARTAIEQLSRPF